MALHNFSMGAYSRRYDTIITPPFTPRSVPGGLMWMDGADPSATGASIQPGLLTSWTDKFWGCNLLAYHVQTANPTVKTLSTMQYAGNFFEFLGDAAHGTLFAGSPPIYNSANSSNLSIYIVSYLKSLSQPNGRPLGLSQDSSTSDVGSSGAVAIRRINDTGQGLNGQGYYTTINNVNRSYLFFKSYSLNELFSCQLSNGNISNYMFPIPVGCNSISNTAYSPSPLNIRYMSIGANTLLNSGSTPSYFNGYISEIIIFSTVVSAANNTLLNTYLINKWNIT